MLRFAEEHLKTWFSSKDRKPLIIRGARQVGKSTLIRNFARNNNIDLVEVNLENVKLRTSRKEIFKIEDLISEIEFQTGKKVNNETLLFLDEVQSDPLLIAKLRYFYELKPELAVICAGSLLELALHQNEISFPVGRVSFYYIGPMKFGEFLLACGRQDLCEAKDNLEVSEAAHDILNEELKKYFFIGGMPKAILAYKETKSMLEARETQRDIALSYMNDFPKYGKYINLDRLQTIFLTVPAFLGRKVIYQHFDRESRSQEIKKVLELLQMANIVTAAFHAEASGIPLNATLDRSIFKLYFLDIGLVNYFHKLSWQDFESNWEGKLYSKGVLAEQFVAQHLAYFDEGREPPSLLYWLRDKTINKAEIDFLIQTGSKIIPIEVKAEKGKKMKSMQIFTKDKNLSFGIKFSKEPVFSEHVSLENGKQIEIKNFPLYSIENLKNIFYKYCSDSSI